MAGSIKGIIVEIGGDTSKLQKALQSVNKTTKNLQGELKGVNRLLEFDPKNTELLAQKQKILRRSIDETKNKLIKLKEAQKLADDTIKKGGKISEENYRNLQREIINTEIKLKNLNKEVSVFTRISKSLDGLSSKMNKLASVTSSVGKSLSKVSFGIGAISGIGIKGAIEQESAMQQVERIYKNHAKTIKDFAKNTASAYNISTKDAYKYSQIYGNLIQGITDDEEANAKYTTELLKSSSIIASATGRTMDDVMDRIRSGLLGNTEAIEDLGVNVNVGLLQTTDAFKKFAGNKSWNQLDFKTQQQIRLFGILEQTTKKYGTELNQNTGSSIQNLSAKMQNLSATLGQKLLPFFNKLLEKLISIADKFNKISPAAQDIIVKSGVIVAALGPILSILGKGIGMGAKIVGFIAKLGGEGGALAGLGAKLSALTGPVGIVIALIGSLAGVFIHLYQTNENFRNQVDELWQGLVEFFNTEILPKIKDMISWLVEFWNTTGQEIVNNVVGIIQKFIDLVKVLWDKVFHPIISFLIEKLKPIFANVFQSVMDKVKVVITFFGEMFKSVTGALGGLIDFITGVFSGDWKKAWEGVKTIFKNIVSGLGAIIKAPLNFIISSINTLIRGLNKVKVPDWVPLVGGKGINIPQIPMLAKGGIVNSPTMAMIGEGRSAEAVLPLDRTLTKYLSKALAEVKGVGRNITVNFYPQTMTETELKRAFDYVDKRYSMSY